MMMKPTPERFLSSGEQNFSKKDLFLLTGGMSVSDSTKPVSGSERTEVFWLSKVMSVVSEGFTKSEAASIFSS